MKMTISDYTELKKRVKEFIDCTDSTALAVFKSTVNNTRYVWDIYYGTCDLIRHIGNRVPVYDYLFDRHIETAMNSILKELGI